VANAVNAAEANSIIDGLIRPAILRLVAETEGEYRDERDLHHHLTTCLAQITNLELGTSRRRVRMEEPAFACYGKGRKGNLDCFFPTTASPSATRCGPRYGVAVELNFDYRDGYKKIKQDIQKLIDPDNAYQQALYFAYGKKRRSYESVILGIERAFNDFAENQPEFRLPLGLHVIVVEYIRGQGHRVREARTTQPCKPSELDWRQTRADAIRDDNVASDPRPSPNSAGSTVTRLGAAERKAWRHWTSPDGRPYFLAFVNQFGSCSLRRFDAGTGQFLGLQKEDGDFQIAFGAFLTEGKQVAPSRQPNLQNDCRPKLPVWVLVELQRQAAK
jgi:hypothetical protein